MLSLFPELLFLAPLSAVLIRLTVSFALAYVASQRLRTGSRVRSIGIVEGVVATLLFLGLYTQAAALLGFALASVYVLAPRLAILPRSTTILIGIMCISLLVTGPGPFTITLGVITLPLSFDLPL